MKAIRKTVNESGLKEIHEFLKKNLKGGAEWFGKEELHAWAEQADFQIGEGNPPTIEIKSWDSIHGYTQEYEISESGLDSEEIDLGDDED